MKKLFALLSLLALISCQPPLQPAPAPEPEPIPQTEPIPEPEPIPVPSPHPRILLIGDSISMGYTPYVREAIAGTVEHPAENCYSTARGLQNIQAWVGDGDWDVIHFNFGLHDLRYIDGSWQVPLEDYKSNLRAIVSILKDTRAELIWASTTPIPTGSTWGFEANVIQYNEAAAQIMQKEGIPIDDLHDKILPMLPEEQIPDNVHFTDHGYQVLAGFVVKSMPLIGKKAALPRRLLRPHPSVPRPHRPSHSRPS